MHVHQTYIKRNRVKYGISSTGFQPQKMTGEEMEDELLFMSGVRLGNHFLSTFAILEWRKTCT